MKLSFIIVTYRRGNFLKQCLESIYQQVGLPTPYEIVIIDNGGDAEITVPDNSLIQLYIERPKKNLGATGGRNLGMQLACGDYWVFQDDDAVWHQTNDVANMIHQLDNSSTCGAVAIRSLNPQTKGVIAVELPHPNKTYIQSVTKPTEVPYFYAVGYAVRADVIRQVGGYPERFFIYMEEIDLSLRIIDAGYQIIYLPNVAVYHHKSNLGRPIAGPKFWQQSTLNKTRMAWRLLPLPFPLTILFFWSLRTLFKTHNPLIVIQIWHDLWQERNLLRQERHPIRPKTIKYLKKIGARLLY